MNTHSIDLESGSTQYLSRADEALLSITGNMTIECWVQFESLPVNGLTGFFMVSKSGASPQRGYGFYVQQSGGVLQLGLIISNDGSATVNKNVTWTFSTGVWYHLAVVYTAAGGTVDFYVNGVAQGAQQTGYPTSIYDNTTAFRIGAEESTGHFDGLIDDVRLWATTRTSTQILDNMRVEIDTATNLVGSWHLNNALTDSSGNAFTLTNNGSAVFLNQVSWFEVSDTAGAPTESLVFEHNITITDTAGVPIESLTNKYGFGNLAKSSTVWQNQAKS